MEVELRRLLEAIVAITDPDLHTVLYGLVTTATEMVGARYGALGVLAPDGRGLSHFVHTGVDPTTVASMGHRLPEGRGVLGQLIDDPRPLRVRDLGTHPAAVGFPPGHPPMSTFLGVPVVVHGRLYGNLYLAEKAPAHDGGAFTEADEELAQALAAVAGTVVANDRLRADAQRLAVLEDRDRIARDLHDLVIQRLFAAGLSLQASISMADDALRPRLQQVVARLDDTISDVRTTIFDLNSAADAGGLRRHLLDVITEIAGAAHGSLRISGAVDTLVSGLLAADVLAVTREAVSNAVRHGAAQRVVVTLDASADAVVVQVDDDGTGIDPAAARSGLLGLEQRAAHRGGDLEVVPGPDGGTRLRWSAPIGTGG